MLALVGWRATTLDPKTALYYRAFEFNDSTKLARRTITEVLRSTNAVSDSDIRAAYRAANAQYAQAFTDMSRIATAARRSGLEWHEAARVMRLSNISVPNVNALLRHYTPTLPMNDETLRRDILRAEVLGTGQTMRELRRRYQVAVDEERKARAEARQQALDRVRQQRAG